MTDENDSTNQMMNDPDNDPKLTAYAMGELSTDEARAVERLIASSPKLATAVDEIRATIESLESALSQEAPLDLVLSGQQRSAIAAAAQTGGLQIDQEATSVIRAAEETPATRSLRWGRWFLAAAIATVLIGGGIFLANPDVQFARQTARNEVSSDKPAGAKTAPEGMEVFADRFEPDLGGQRNEIASDESASARVDEENLDLAVAASQLAVAKTDGPLSVARRESSSQVRSLRSKLSSIDSPREGIERFGRLQGAEAMQEFQQEMDDVQSKDDLIAAIGGRGGAGMGGGMLPPPAAASPQRFAPMRRSLDGNELLSRESFGEQSPRASSKASVGDRPARRLSRSRDAGKNVMEKRKTNLIQSRQQRQAQAAKPNSKVKPQVALKKKASKSWKSVKAIPNTTRLMVGDKEELDLTGMQVNVQVDGFRARVLIDYLYYNDRDQPLEGDFKIRLPVDSSLYYFAFGESANELTPQQQLATREFVDNGARTVSFTPAAITKSRNDLWRNVKEARMVPREQAAHAFRETVRRRVDPALVQWSGAGVFSAKVFPLAAKKVHRIVIGYDVNLTRSGGRLLYQLDLPKSTGDCRIEINARDVDGVQYKIQPEVEPVEVDHNDELHQRFTFDQRPADGVRLTATAEIPLLLKSNELADEFWATQLAPELPAQQTAGSSRGVFMLDTSLSSSPDKFNVWLKLLEATLAKNRDTMKEFAVLTFSVDGRFWKPQYVANTDGNLDELKATLGNLVLEGATDLYAAMEKVTTTEWVTDGEAPDFFLLSDGAANWGETNGRLIGSLFADQKTGSLFAYQTGMTGTAIANLRFLTGQTGGAVFSVTSEDEIAAAATAHRKRPWRLLGISAEGATDVMTAGRAEWVYPGQVLTVVGRGVVSGPMKLEFEQSKKTITVTDRPTEIFSDLTGRLYGQIAVGQLESLGSEAFDVSAAYARHFRVTGETCSLLMLESEEDYQRFDIKPEEDELVIKSKLASKWVADMLEKSASRLSNPKAQLRAWLKRLETMPGMDFTMSTALKVAIDDIDVVAVSQPLVCTPLSRDDVSKGYLAALQQEQLDYDIIAGQAKKRGRGSIDESIKVFSSLIERNPGDIGIARDVAFTAMELDRPAQAYHLLRSVARQRPFQGSIYPAIGQCLTQTGQADMAIVYYEVALAGEFQRQGSNFREIVAVDYQNLLRRIVSGKAKSSVVDFAKARLETLAKKMPISKADLVVTMMWNQDQTDVDLHVIEPSGEECFYSHNETKSGGKITDDITTGFGPEMYFNQTAPDGTYEIAVKFFGSGQNRTSVKNKVYLSVFEDFGSDHERVSRRTIRLKDAGEHRTVMKVKKK